MTALTSAGAFGRALTDNLLLYFDFDQSGLGPTPREVGVAVRRFLGLSIPADRGVIKPAPRATIDDIYALAHDDLARFDRDDGSGLSSTLYVAYVSSFFHEARHVHDLLSTGFGLDILLANCQCYQNAILLADQLLSWQERGAGRKIALPVSPQRGAMMGLDIQATKVLERYISLSGRTERHGAPERGIYSWMSNLHLLEASASLVQLDTIHDLFGNRGLEIFDDLVQDSDAMRKYMLLINDVLELVDRRSSARDQMGRSMSFLLWVALQGNERRQDDDGTGGGPAQRVREGRRVLEGRPSEVAYFQALSEYVTRASQGELDLDQTRRFVDKFNALWGFARLDAAIAAKQRQVIETADRLIAGWDDLSKDLAVEFGGLFPAMRDAYLKLTAQIIAAPESYFVGRQYALSILLGRFPALQVEFKAGGEVYSSLTPGQPSLRPEIWQKATLYSTILRLLAEGRCSNSAPHLEEECFRLLTEEVGLRFADGLFD